MRSRVARRPASIEQVLELLEEAASTRARLAARDLGELFEELALALVEPRGHLDHEPYQQVSARPTAATSTSARRQTAARSRVRECATVTVAFAASSSCAIGLPTSLERPTTTASAPRRLSQGLSPGESSEKACWASWKAETAVQGAIAGRPARTRPRLAGVTPSTSFCGESKP